MEKTMVKQAVPLQPMEDDGGADIHLQPMEVNGGADIHLQPMEDPMLEQVIFMAAPIKDTLRSVHDT
ncbi:acid sphingomyelinase-like phosphodiesterase 3b [Grus japonensis]|uniref:Acid sphingomyelinase-like phosphodiesterase 3b n=1 Tax=Grus japonensis TaxID=30415 RepID=A0ABC9Y9M0_GRUJA